MNEYKVWGTIHADINFEEIVESASEDLAIKIAEERVYAKCGINAYDVQDDEIYCDKLRVKKNAMPSL